MTISLFLFLLAALVWGGVQFLAARKEARAEAEYPPQGQILMVDGHRVHAVVMGQPAGSAPDVVLIHGSSGSTRDMSFRLAPMLADRYRVILLDRPGLGYSDRINRSGATIRQQAALLQAAAQQLGADSPIVLGQSYGGAVALAWAVDHPDTLAALVPVAAVSHPWTTPLDPYYQVTSSWLGSLLAVPLITAFVPDKVVDKALVEVFAPQAVPDGYAAHFGTGMTLRRISIRANAAQRANLLAEVTDLQQQYESIRVPTEILHGLADDTVNPQLHSAQLAARIPGAVVTWLDGIGHMPQHVASEEVAAAVDRAARRANLR